MGKDLRGDGDWGKKEHLAWGKRENERLHRVRKGGKLMKVNGPSRDWKDGRIMQGYSKETELVRKASGRGDSTL